MAHGLSHHAGAWATGTDLESTGFEIGDKGRRIGLRRSYGQDFQHGGGGQKEGKGQGDLFWETAHE
jgi:hypothetical protein